jgi:hypothetical protein
MRWDQFLSIGWMRGHAPGGVKPVAISAGLGGAYSWPISLKAQDKVLKYQDYRVFIVFVMD